MGKNKQHKYSQDIIKLLREISLLFPTTPIATHIYMATEEYGNLENLTDKTFYNALEIYKCTKELDLSIQHEENIDKIIEDSKNLNIDSLFDEDEEY